MRHNEKLRLFLVDELKRRKEKNPFYSMNSFARSLELSSGALSQILAGKRSIGSRTAFKISQNLATSGTPELMLKNPFIDSPMLN